MGAGLGPRRGDLDPYLAAAIGLSPSRVHQLVAEADRDALDAAFGELRQRAAPALGDPDSGEDTGLDGRDNIAGRQSDEVSWLRQCAGWLRQLDGGGYPPAVSLRPSSDRPDRVTARVRRSSPLPHVDELARARRAGDLDTAAVLPGPRAERRRRLAEPDLEFRAFCARKGLPASSTLPLGRAWDAWQAERYRCGETGQRPGYTGNPFRPR